MAKSALDYQTLNQQLEEILESLQAPDIQVDKAVDLYEQGLKVVAQLEDHLKMAENKITRLKLQAKA